MKLMGKRQVGEMQMSELVTAFFLSELATFTVTDSDIPLLYGIIPILLLICMEVIISFFAIKNPLMKRLFDFSPGILIDRGRILEKELARNRVTIDELLSLLRQNGFFDLKKVNYAILEPNGQLSVIPFDRDDSVTKKDLGLTTTNEPCFTVAVIDDGKINQKALDAIGKNEVWVKKILEKHRIGRVQDVFLMASDFVGNVTMIKKDMK